MCSWCRSPSSEGVRRIKKNSLVKILFTDSWATPGMLKQLFTVMLHGRQNHRQIQRPGQPAGAGGRESRRGAYIAQVVAGVAGCISAASAKCRSAPILSHRRTQVNSLLSSTGVERAIADDALAKSMPIDKVRENARRYALEIAPIIPTRPSVPTGGISHLAVDTAI